MAQSGTQTDDFRAYIDNLFAMPPDVSTHMGNIDTHARTQQLLGAEAAAAAAPLTLPVKSVASNARHAMAAATLGGTEALPHDAPGLQVLFEERQPASAASECEFCKHPVSRAQARVDMPCGHAYHLRCTLHLAAAKRTWCAGCPAPAPNSIDAGGDADVRGSLMEALEHARNKVRSRLGFFARSQRRGTAAAPAHALTRRADAAVIRQRNAATLYGTLPRGPGGACESAAPKAAAAAAPGSRWFARFVAQAPTAAPTASSGGGGTCTAADCGGPRYCVHKYLDVIDPDAAYAARIYDLPAPTRAPPGHMDRARAAIDAALALHVHPAELYRCGGDAARLSVLGYSIGDLCGAEAYALEDVIEGLQLDWRGLKTLGFRLHMLGDKTAFPVVALARPPIGLDVSKMGEFQFGFDTLLYEYNLNAEELAALRFDARTLRAFNMDGGDLARLARDKTVHARGLRWFVRAFGLDRCLFDALGVDQHVLQAEPDLRGYLAAFDAAIEAEEAGARARACESK
jgi:hypothetical protein